MVIASPGWSADARRAPNLKKIRGTIGFHLEDWAAGTYAAEDYVWNGGRAYRCLTGGTSVSGPTGTGGTISDGGTATWAYWPSLREDYAGDDQVIGGPDLYSVFLDHTEWLQDGLHPNSAGNVQWKRAWVSWANAAIYR